MKPRAVVIVLGTVVLAASHSAASEDGLCKPLKIFIASVKPDETRVLKFHTSWGSNFKDDEEPAFIAKRCDHGDYEPAKAVCEYLMEHGATEFSGNPVDLRHRSKVRGRNLLRLRHPSPCSRSASPARWERSSKVSPTRAGTSMTGRHRLLSNALPCAPTMIAVVQSPLSSASSAAG